MPSFMGIGIAGETLDGRRYPIEEFDDEGGGGPLTINEAILIVQKYVCDIIWSDMSQSKYEKFLFYDLKEPKEKWPQVTLNREELKKWRMPSP